MMKKYKNASANKLIEHDMYYYMLKKFHYFFTKEYDDIFNGEIRIYKINAKWKKDDIKKYLLSIEDDLKYAYELKKKYREFNLSAEYSTCDEELDELIHKFTNSHLEEYRIFGKMIRRWRNEIKNSFIKVKIGMSKDGKYIIKNTYSYRYFNRFRNRYFFPLIKMNQY